MVGGLREGQRGGGVATKWQLLFRHGRHSGGCAGIDLMEWEGAVDGSPTLGCADISPAFLFFQPPTLSSTSYPSTLTYSDDSCH